MRLVNADAIPSYKRPVIGEDGFEFETEIVYKFSIDDAPTIDAVEVIRCKDCRWYNKSLQQCERQVCMHVFDNDFCSYGERKEETEAE